MLDPTTRARIAASSGRLGGLRNVARNGGQAVSAGARAGFWRRFEHEVDPEGRLDPEERSKRAHFAMRAYMAELALKRTRR